VYKGILDTGHFRDESFQFHAVDCTGSLLTTKLTHSNQNAQKHTKTDPLTDKLAPVETDVEETHKPKTKPKPTFAIHEMFTPCRPMSVYIMISKTAVHSTITLSVLHF